MTLIGCVPITMLTAHFSQAELPIFIVFLVAGAGGCFKIILNHDAAGIIVHLSTHHSTFKLSFMISFQLNYFAFIFILEF